MEFKSSLVLFLLITVTDFILIKVAMLIFYEMQGNGIFEGFSFLPVYITSFLESQFCLIWVFMC